MNEKQINSLMQNLDSDLINNEMDALMGGIEMDIESISAKAHEKLRKEQCFMKNKRRKMFVVIAASLCIVVGTSAVCASEISDFIKSFLGKVGIYSTVVEGSAYYLESPVPLDGGCELRKVMFTNDSLDLVLFTPDNKIPAELTVQTADGSGEPFSLSKSQEGLELTFIKLLPTSQFELTVDGKKYSVNLASASAISNGAELFAAQSKNGIDWVNLGYRRTDTGIQIIASFTDQALSLSAIGEPSDQEVNAGFDNNTHNSKTTSLSPKTLIGTDQEGNAYIYSYDPTDTGRPLTMFYSDAPKDKLVNIEVPSIVVVVPKEITKISVAIPELDKENSVNQEIDLGLQKMTLQSVKRTSATKAVLKFEVNTSNQQFVSIRGADINSRDVQSGELLWKDGLCTMTVIFDETLTETELVIAWPSFVVNGDWTLSLK